jgi:hypothetical protein
MGRRGRDPGWGGALRDPPAAIELGVELLVQGLRFGFASAVGGGLKWVCDVLL